MSITSDSPNTEQLKQVAEGTALYYALLYSDQIASQRAVATLHYIKTISTTLFDVSEPQVAEKKIHWWHEELAHIAKQQARHPACVEVQGFLHTNEMVKAGLCVLSAAATERYNAFATEQELQTSVLDDYTARIHLFENALSASLESLNAQAQRQPQDLSEKTIQFHTKEQLSDAASTMQNPLALGLALFDRLNNLPMRLRAGFSVFSDERYAQFGTSPEELLRSADKATDLSSAARQNAQALIEQSIVEAFNELDTAPLKDTSLPIQILSQIRQSQLKLWMKRKPDLLTESISLTPVRKFIAAYRCKRRFAKA